MAAGLIFFRIFWSKAFKRRSVPSPFLPFFFHQFPSSLTDRKLISGRGRLNSLILPQIQREGPGPLYGGTFLKHIINERDFRTRLSQLFSFLLTPSPVRPSFFLPLSWIERLRAALTLPSLVHFLKVSELYLGERRSESELHVRI